MFSSEIKKSTNIYLFLALILIGSIICLSSMYDSLKGYINILGGSDKESLSSAAVEYLNNLSNQHLNSYMGWRYGIRNFDLIGIILASLVYSFTYILDKKSGILKNILLRTRRKKYFLTKVGINFSLGGLVAIIPTLITLLIGIILLDNSVPISTGDLVIDFPKGFLAEYFSTSPMIYISFITVVLFFIGGVYATFSMAIGCLTKKIIPSILIPVLFWYIVSLIFNLSGLSILAPWNIFYFMNIPNMSFVIPLIETLIVLGASLFIIYKECEREKI